MARVWDFILGFMFAAGLAFTLARGLEWRGRKVYALWAGSAIVNALWVIYWPGSWRASLYGLAIMLLANVTMYFTQARDYENEAED